MGRGVIGIAKPMGPGAGHAWLAGLGQDVRYALRTLRRDRALVATGQPALVLEVRSARDPALVSRGVRTAIAAADPDLAIGSMAPLATTMRESIRAERVLAILAVGFGLVAVLLAAIGVYGVMAYAVARRTREIGVRTAMGASQGDVLRLILEDGAHRVAVGAIVGVPLALLASRLLHPVLHNVAGTDPLSLGLAVTVLVAFAAVAALIPSLRASRLPPTTALRQE